MEDLGRRGVAEGIGAFFLVFVGVGAGMSGGVALGPVGGALAFGLAIAVMVFATGHLSGAHLNPAVTVAFTVVRRFPARDAVVYVACQCAGATAGALALCALLGEAGGVTLPALPAGSAVGVEAALTFALVFVIMAVATDPRVAPGFAAIAIGAAVASGALAGGPLTGAAMNPARSLGPAIATGVWTGHWIYWVGPLGGGLLAAGAYEWLRPVEAPRLDRPLGVLGPID